MRNYIFITLLSTCLLCLSGQANAQSKSACFSLQSAKLTKEIPIQKTFSNSKNENQLKMFKDIESVYGIAVTMDINRLSDDFLVRILLEDTKGKIHLIAESYKEIATKEKSLSLSEYCEETALLEAVSPACLHVIANNAEVMLSSLIITTEISREIKTHSENFQKQTDILRKQQVQTKVDLINAYNKANNKLWKAGITSLSLMTFEEKMRVLGSSFGGNTYGIEYYSKGIIDIGIASSSQPKPKSPSLYVEEFDWRDRHGKNWISSVKDQGNSGYCSAFTAVSCTEALINLYLNSIVNLDLSEQEAACCNNYTSGSTSNFYVYGMPISSPLEYIRDVGICEEESYPFVDDSLARFCHSDQVVPQTIVTISSISSNLRYNEDRIKNALINCGPLASGIYARGDGGSSLSHAMALIGYGLIKEGDIVQRIWNYTGYYTGLTDTIHVSHGHPLIGRNFWIFKNSHLYDGTVNPPYMLVTMDLNTSIQDTYALYNPSWKQRTSTGNYVEINDVICEDADGDGYYFWGLGPKPSSAPSGIPDERDGDDSNPLLGQMDEYGYCEDLNPATRPVEIISVTQSTSGMARQYSHIEVTNNATWTVGHNRTFYNGAKITIRNGCSLILTNGAVLENVEIVMESGATLKILENGKVHLRDGIGFEHPVGAVVEIEYGEIV